MENKTCLITGATSGIGKALVYKLARFNVNLIILARNMQKGEKICGELLEKNKYLKVKLYVADISSLEEIRKSVPLIKNDINKLDILINNAGSKFNKYYLSDDNFELTFATNYLGHFLLTVSLLDLLSNSFQGRIINISSSSHNGGDITAQNIFRPEIYNSGEAYRNSKLAVIYFTYELARILSNTNITVNAVNPGHVATKIKLNNGVLPWLKHYIDFGLKGKLISAPKAAESILNLALEEKFSKTTGKYFQNLNQINSSQISYNREISSNLFKSSLDLVGLNDMNFDKLNS